ncbi:MAG: ABC transporter permease [Flavobacteriales bacterium]|tara:strand:+ start:947 stop:2161 length:1215 start_codon:yes stop_codon:yes gene_type:complete
MLIKLAWRNIWRNKKRSLITITAIVIAVFLAICMRSLQLGMYDNMIKNVVGSYSGHVQIHSNGYWEEQTIDNAFLYNDSLIKIIENNTNVEHTTKRIQSGCLSSFDDLSKFVFVNGIEPQKEQLMTNWNKRLMEGELLTPNSSSINIGKGIAKYYNIKVGDTLIFVGQGYHGMQAVGAFPVCGILDMKNPNLNNVSVFMSLSTAQDFLSANDLMTHLIINKKEYTDEESIVSSLSENFKEEYEIMTWQEMMPEIEQVIQADSAGGLVMIFILYMIITFGIFGTVLMMTQERKYEFGVVVSIGMRKIKLMIAMVYETIFLTSIGVLSGIILSRPLVLYFYNNPLEFPAEQAEMIENQGFEAVIPFMSSYDIPITHGLIIFFISLFISIYPVITIYNLNPVKAMKR